MLYCKISNANIDLETFEIKTDIKGFNISEIEEFVENDVDMEIVFISKDKDYLLISTKAINYDIALEKAFEIEKICIQLAETSRKINNLLVHNKVRRNKSISHKL